MKLLVIALLLVTSLIAQDNWAGLGVSYNSGVAGTAFYARRLTGSTFSFSVYQALPTSYKPFVVNFQQGSGVAQKVASIGKVDLFIPGTVGISNTGINTGWNFNTGGLAAIPIKGTWHLYPVVMMNKSSIAGYQIFGGILIGWGW